MREEIFENIEKMIRTDGYTRGLDQIKSANQLKLMSKAIMQSQSIIILTGFCIKQHMIGETDGPPGAVMLAKALTQLNKKVMIVTDHFSEGLIKNNFDVIKQSVAIEIISKDNSITQIDDIFERFDPDHVIAIERPGKSDDGDYHSMRGEKLTEVMPDTDYLFKKAQQFNVLTSAIGDGGNELGMGKIKPMIEANLCNGNTIAASIAADYLLLATVSNWGAEGLITALSIRSGKNLLLSGDQLEALIKRMVTRGAVDGLTLKQEATVDGFSLERNLKIHNLLEKLI